MPPSNQIQQPGAPQPTYAPGPVQGVPPAPQPIPQAATPTTGSDAKAATTQGARKNPNSTQNALLISEIRDGLVIMNDGSARAVVTCRSINFDLMSDRERDAAEFSYQQLLNSLYFPI